MLVVIAIPDVLERVPEEKIVFLPNLQTHAKELGRKISSGP